MEKTVVVLGIGHHDGKGVAFEHHIVLPLTTSYEDLCSQLYEMLESHEEGEGYDTDDDI